MSSNLIGQEVIAWATFDISSTQYPFRPAMPVRNGNNTADYTSVFGSAYINGTLGQPNPNTPSGYLGSPATFWGMSETDPADVPGGADKFVVRKARGNLNCFCGSGNFGPLGTSDCGDSDNLITIGPIDISAYDAFKIVYELEVRGRVDCADSQLPSFSCDGTAGKDEVFISYTLDDSTSAGQGEVHYGSPGYNEIPILYACTASGTNYQTPSCGNSQGSSKLNIFIRIGNQAEDEK